MEYRIVRTEVEIDDLLNECADAEAEGSSRFRGMTFEQGISYAIKWITDNSEPYPLED